MRASASLDQLIGAPMPVQEFLTLALRAAGELAARNGRGAIHGDIRPCNILFDAATGEVALVSSATVGGGPSLSEVRDPVPDRA